MIEVAIAQILEMVIDNVYSYQIESKADLPALCYQSPREVPVLTIDGTGYRSARVQVSIVSIKIEETSQLTKEVRHFLSGLKGSFGGINIYLIKEKETIPDFSGDPDVYRKIIDFNFHYGE